MEVTRFRVIAASLILAGWGLYVILYDLTPDLSLFWDSRNGDFDFDSPLNYSGNELIILSWTKYWGSNYEHVRIQNGSECPYLHLLRGALTNSSGDAFTLPCRINYDRRYLRFSDAVVFHSHDLWQDSNLPEWRSDKQVWIYLQQESPVHTRLNLSKYSHIFDWTMTYRRDSDIYHPYRHIVPLTEANPSALKSLPDWTARPHLLAWIVSNRHTNSKREKLVSKLQQFIPVNIYGHYDHKSKPCPPEGDCYRFVGATHKFYLSLENSLCADYITEKFFDALDANMVPVVYGGSQGSDYSAIAPNGSYIDVRDFRSLKDLADYLIFLDKNDGEYEKYFEWKRDYRVVRRGGWCTLCQRLFQRRRDGLDGRNRRRSKDLMRWWWNRHGDGGDGPACSPPIERFVSS